MMVDKISTRVVVKKRRFWVSKKIRDKLSSSYFHVSLNNISFLARLNKDRRVVIPLKFQDCFLEEENLTAEFRILNSCKKPAKFLLKNKIDVLYFVPEKTLSNHPILVQNSGNSIHLWYAAKGGTKEVFMSRFVNFDFVRLLGYYQAEGGKFKLRKRRGREVNFTNISLDIIFDFVILSKQLISIEKWTTQIRYTNSHSKQDLGKISFFLRKIGLDPKKFHFVKGKKMKNISIRLIITESVLADFFSSFLDRMRTFLSNDHSKVSYILSSYFLQGLIAGDGNVYCVKSKTTLHPRLSIFEEKKKYLESYSKILKKFSIQGNWVKKNKKNLYIFSGYINKSNVKSVINYQLLKYSPDNERKLFKAKNVFLADANSKFKISGFEVTR